MELKYATTEFLTVNFVLSLPLWQIILTHISKKPLLSVTLVDLIYRDIIYYNISLCFVISTGIVNTLLYDDQNLRSQCYKTFYGRNLQIFVIS